MAEKEPSQKVSAKSSRKTMPVTALTVKLDVNVREENNYDIPTMMEQIRQAGRILKPIIAEKVGDEFVVLSGNRRTWGGQELMKLADIPADLKSNLEKVDVQLYEGLSEDERLTLIMDHGGEKPISRTEIVKCCWRMDKQFFSEANIISLMYFALAAFTGNMRKLVEVPSEPKARETFLRRWFHGTLGNFILAALKMGPYVKEQFILTTRSEDKLLKEGEKVEMRCTRDRINQLSQAKSADKAEWTPEKGSPAFNKLIEQFKAEDAGLVQEDKKKRPTVAQLLERADSFNHPIVRKVLRLAAGEATEDERKSLANEEEKLYRDHLVLGELAKAYDGLKEPYKTFAHYVLDKTPAEVTAYLKSVS